jgi:transposase
MKRIVFAAAAAGLIAPFLAGGAALADPGDQWREQFKIRAECDKKLDEAKSRREFYKELRECNKKLAEWDSKQREEAFKAWQEREKKWRERWDD